MNTINDNFFYSISNPKDGFEITNKILENLKSLNSSIEEGYYYNSVLTWSYKNNSHLSIEEFCELFPTIQFITMTSFIKDSFIKKYDVRDYHISLLRRTYIELSENEPLISLGYKRPFGNSSVLSDVENEISSFRQLKKTNMNDYTHSQQVLDEFINILDKLISEEGFILKCKSFTKVSTVPLLLGHGPKDNIWYDFFGNKNEKIHSYLREWTIDLHKIRSDKIENIIS